MVATTVLPLPRRGFRHARQHDLHSVRQPGGRGLYAALRNDAGRASRRWARQSKLDGIGDRLMHRLAYREFRLRGTESVVGGKFSP